MNGSDGTNNSIPSSDSQRNDSLPVIIMDLNIFCQPRNTFSSQLFCFFWEKNPKPRIVQPIDFFDKLHSTGNIFQLVRGGEEYPHFSITKKTKPQPGNEKHQHQQMDKAAGGFAGAT